MLSYCQFRNKKKGESSDFVTPIVYKALTFNVIDANGTVGERLLRNVHVSFTRDTIYFMSLVMRKPVFRQGPLQTGLYSHRRWPEA